MPSDISDHLYQNDHVENDGYLEFIINAERKGHLPLVDKIRRVLAGQTEVKSMYEIRDYDYDNVKIELDINGRTRTIDLCHIERLRTYFDVTENVKIGTNGHPTFTSIDQYAKELMKDIIATMGIQNVQ